MAEIGLEALDRDVRKPGKRTSPGLHLVIIHRGRAVELDSVDGRQWQSGSTGGVSHREKQSVAGTGRARDMVGIVRDRSSVHPDGIRACKLAVICQQNSPAGLSKIESAAGLVVWPADIRAERLERGESADNEAVLDIHADYRDIVIIPGKNHSPGNDDGRDA